VRRANRGGNCNGNRRNAGAFYVRLNNTASNSNWNIGSAQSYLFTEQQQNAPFIPCLLAKINSMRASVSSLSKVDERIR
jgi:hypothetical protein